MLDDIVLFVHIVNQQSLAAAARELDMPVATVTRRLQRLENTVRSHLLHRTARRFELTAEGEVYFRAYAHLVDQFEQTQHSLSDDINDMRGALKVMAPVNLSAGFLQPMWAGFIQAFPDIQLELSLSNQLEDMLSEKADFAIRVGPQPDSLLYQKRLGTIQTLLVAAPDYLAAHGEPESIADLSHHKLIGAQAIMSWTLQKQESKECVNLSPVLSTLVNDVNIAASFVRDGLGISLLPTTETQAYLDNGKMVRLLADWRGLDREIYAVWPSGRLMNQRTKRLLAYIEQHFVNYLLRFKKAI